MIIKSIQIKNYKSFWESKQIEFKPGINLIIGKNNAGKTALLEALGLQFENKPHLNVDIIPDPNIQDSLKPPNIRLIIGLRGKEVVHLFKGTKTIQFVMPLIFMTDKVAFRWGNLVSSHDKILKEAYSNLEKFQEIVSETIPFSVIISKGPQDAIYARPLGDSIGIFDEGIFSPRFDFRVVFEEGRFTLVEGIDDNKDHSIWDSLDYEGRIYAFKAERLNIARSKIGENSELNSDASNLPETLHYLQTNNSFAFEKLNGFIQTIFPSIQRINSRIVQGMLEITVWGVGQDLTRPDLTIPLSDVGSGVGQILAILFVVLSSKHPQVIIIDEPQSFLHPGAVRKLMSILEMYPQHQYIISTHSPTVISSTSPSTIHLVRLEAGQSQVSPIDAEDTRQQGLMLNEIGVRLADVFGADNIIWVEGPTEEEVFKLIVKKLLKKPLLGTMILSVLHTGDFEKKGKSSKDHIIQLYRKISTGGSLYPPALAFYFDREYRSVESRNDLEKRITSGESTEGPSLHFTSKAMFENSLLHPEAIAKYLETFDDYPENTPKDSQTIKTWMDENKGMREFWKEAKLGEDQKEQCLMNGEWKEEIHGAKFLARMFSQLTGQKVEYKKTRDSVGIAEVLIEHFPEELEDYRQKLKEILSPNSP